MQVNDAKELKGMHDENARLKKLLVERDLKLDVMKKISEKKWWALAHVVPWHCMRVGAARRVAILMQRQLVWCDIIASTGFMH